MLPVTPDRIVPMHRYRVGSWYPFRDPMTNTIGDPKTTSAVGGLLCALSETQISNFKLYTSRFAMLSTARYIGEMDASPHSRVLRARRLVTYSRERRATSWEDEARPPRTTEPRDRSGGTRGSSAV